MILYSRRKKGCLKRRKAERKEDKMARFLVKVNRGSKIIDISTVPKGRKITPSVRKRFKGFKLVRAKSERALFKRFNISGVIVPKKQKGGR